ncbi:MAG: tripartite tricarboxylate transporter TctB family protein [Acetobacteraceae bacterium]
MSGIEDTSGRNHNVLPGYARHEGGLLSNLTGKANRDYWGGALMVLLGLGAMLQGSHYRVGTVGHMGPGFFPMALGAILAFVGLCLIVAARLAAPAAASARPAPEWRAWILICLSIVTFAVVGTYGGLLPATFAIVFISALADRSNTILNALVLSLAIEGVCVVVFWWLLQVQFPLFRWG